jgi:2,4-dienoyl-CoA reductase (NADPH2)
MSSTKFRKLLEPGRIGSLTIKNRILKTGSSPGFYPWEDGYIQQEAIDIYESLAKGGAGIVTIGAAPLGVPPGRGYALDDDKYIPRMQQLADKVQKYCPIFLQAFHLGPMLPPFLANAGVHPIAASALGKDELPNPHLVPCQEMTVAGIEGIVEAFGDQVNRAKRAGFQGVELNAACDHLLNSFLSPFWNRRHDAYGIDSFESRAKIVVDIIKEIKRLNGKDFAVIALINGAEPGLDNGMTPTDAQGIAKVLEAAGADAIHVRNEYYNRPKNPANRDNTQFPDIALYPESTFPVDPAQVDASHHGVGGGVPPAIAVKKVVSIPVIAVGRLAPDIGEKLLRRGVVDFVSFNRRLMADNDLPNKLAEGRYEDIRPCTGCVTCFDNNEKGNPPLCQVNAAWGKNKAYEIKPAKKKKRVMVVGSGPAGMETALVAAQRGHEVTLYDKEPWFGGSMVLAALVKGFNREDILGLVKYYKTQLIKLGVEIKLGQEVNRAVVEEVKPDVLVIAAGGTHDIPDVPGIDRRKVLTSQALHRRLKGFLRFFSPKVLRWLTNFWMPLGKKVVIMGGNIQGCQTAEFLVKRGRKVTIVDTAKEIGDGLLDAFVKPHLINWLEVKGVDIFPSVKYNEITDKGLTVTLKDGKEQTFKADTILTALPLKPNTELIKSLDGIVPEFYAIGDCKEPQLIVNAIADGARIGRAI